MITVVTDDPPALVTVSRTAKFLVLPGGPFVFVNVCVAFCVVPFAVPSAHAHDHEVIGHPRSIDVSVNVTTSGLFPEVGVALKAAIGARHGAGVGVSDISGVGVGSPAGLDSEGLGATLSAGVGVGSGVGRSPGLGGGADGGIEGVGTG
jgi:hypothetical protein